MSREGRRGKSQGLGILHLFMASCLLNFLWCGTLFAQIHMKTLRPINIKQSKTTNPNMYECSSRFARSKLGMGWWGGASTVS